jgi:16S rRNA C967 or C1407 C5-methylase (RsmB/RsmF family)
VQWAIAVSQGQAVEGCFHKVTMNRNANRQKRILANAAAIVQPGGYLLYSTCTYAPAENEQVCTWFLKKFPQFEPIAVEPLQAFQSHLTPLPCYRFVAPVGIRSRGLFDVAEAAFPRRSPTSE